MNNFETALSNIDERVKAYDSKLEDIKNSLKKRFEELAAHREQIIKDLTIITNRDGDTNRQGDPVDFKVEIPYEIRRMSWGFCITIAQNGYDCKDLPSELIDDVKDLSSAEDTYVELINIDKNNQRFDDVLKAYLMFKSRHADRTRDRFEKLLNECC